MKTQRLRQALDTMVSREGILGMALVEKDTGMVWQAVGQLGSIEDVASAATDYWRLHQRTQHSFEALGALRVAILMHGKGQITVRECGESILLITVSTRLGAVDWEQWRADYPALVQLVNDM
jgi:hypothetical protein